MTRMLAALAVSALLLPAGASAQQKHPQKKQPAQSAAQQMPPMPKPAPEIAELKKDVGVWDATVETTDPSGKTSTSKGTETVRMIGFWQVGDFKSQMMGQPFEGMGTLTWDPTKKKYVGTWIDSMTPGFASVEGELSADKKTLNSTFEGPDMSGKTVKMRTTSERPDAQTRVFTMYGPKGSDGKEPVMMKITYKRRGGGAR